MEYKHFSHTHGLVFHQLNPGSEIQCSGCNISGSGNVYVCWQCSYFLHERCYTATRSLNSPSHPLHPLTLMPYPTHDSSTYFCDSCNLVGNGLSYCCAQCNFDLHIHCAHVPLYPPLNPSLAANVTATISGVAHQNPIYPSPPQSSSFPSYPDTPSLNISSNNTYPPMQNSPFPSYDAPSNLPAYPPPSDPSPPLAVPPPQTNPVLPIYTPSSSLVSTPPEPTPQPQPHPPQPNMSLPIYTPPNASITVIPPPQPTPPPATISNPSPPPATQQSSDHKPQQNTSSLIKHFSHPHVLLPMELEKKNAKVCSACECELSGAAYCCTDANCTFNLHKACFDSPQEVRHKCHLDHPLTLIAAPPYNDGFTCNACLKDGKGFAYHCETCSYDLHIDCIAWPETVTRPDHKHALSLYYSSPTAANANQEQETVFMCDVCTNPVHEMAWVYYCRDCDYGTHLECVASGLLPNSDSAGQTDDELLGETELKFAVLQLLLSGGLSGNINYA